MGLGWIPGSEIRDLQPMINASPMMHSEIAQHFREFDVEELKNRTRLNLDYAAEKQKEIQQLETAVNTLKNTTAIKESQIIKLGQVTSIQ